jgi:hypothetical protein
MSTTRQRGGLYKWGDIRALYKYMTVEEISGVMEAVVAAAKRKAEDEAAKAIGENV